MAAKAESKGAKGLGDSSTSTTAMQHDSARSDICTLLLMRTVRSPRRQVTDPLTNMKAPSGTNELLIIISMSTTEAYHRATGK